MLSHPHIGQFVDTSIVTWWEMAKAKWYTAPSVVTGRLRKWSNHLQSCGIWIQVGGEGVRCSTPDKFFMDSESVFRSVIYWNLLRSEGIISSTVLLLVDGLTENHAVSYKMRKRCQVHGDTFCSSCRYVRPSLTGDGTVNIFLSLSFFIQIFCVSTDPYSSSMWLT